MNFKDVKNVKEFDAIFSTVGERKIAPTEFYDSLEVPEELRMSLSVVPFNPIVSEEVKQINKKGRENANIYLLEKGYKSQFLFDSIAGMKELSDTIAKADKVTREDIRTAKSILASIQSEANSLNGLSGLIESYDKVALGKINSLQEDVENEKDPEKKKKMEGLLKKSKKNSVFATLANLLNLFKGINEDYEGVFYSSRDLSRLFDIMIAHVVKIENHITKSGDGELSSYSGEFGTTQLYQLQLEYIKWLENAICKESGLSKLEIVGL